MSNVESKSAYFRIEKSVSKHAFNMPGGHMHGWNELYYLFEGERRYFIDGQIYTVCEGDVILIPKSTPHHTTSISSRPHIRYLVEFGDDLIQESLHPFIDKCFQVRHFTLSSEQRATFEKILQKSERELSTKSPCYEALLKAYTTELLVLTIRLLQSGCQIRDRQKTPTEQLIESSTSYIEKNLQSDLKLTHLSDKYHLSPSYFSRIFKAYTGFGFNEYLTHLRIQKATQLLRNTSEPISEIAYWCGFSDSNYFSTVFKKETGLSPIKYRMLQ